MSSLVNLDGLSIKASSNKYFWGVSTNKHVD